MKTPIYSPGSREEAAYLVGRAAGLTGERMLFLELVRLGFAPSNGEARRLVRNGLVEVDGVRATDESQMVRGASQIVLRRTGR